MDIPILDRGEPVGRVTIREDGLYRVLEGRLPFRPGLQRLWLCAAGEGVCLGVLTPEGGELVVRKRLSRSAWKALPRPPRFAALSPPEPEAAPAPEETARESPAVPVSLPTGEPVQEIRLFGRRFVVFRS